MLILISLFATSLFAKEVFVQDFDLYNRGGSYRGMVQTNAKFYVDTEAGQGYLDVSALEHYDNYPRYPRCNPYYCEPMPIPAPWRLLDEKVAVPGLVVEGKELVYKSEEGDVVCATLGRTRWTGNLLIKLTGNCQVEDIYNYGTMNLRVSLHVK